MFPLLFRVAFLLAHVVLPPRLSVASADPAQQQLDDLARPYRIQVYNTYRLDRAELDRHRALWDEARSRYVAAGANANDRSALVAWLDAATAAVRDRRQPPTVPFLAGDDSQLPDSDRGTVFPNAPPLERAKSESHATSPRRSTAPPSRHHSAPAHQPRSAVAQSFAKTTEPRINLAELQVRAAGFQVGMRTVNSLLHNDEPLNVRQLGVLLDELESLLVTRGDLLLYHEATPADEQQRIDELLKYPQPTVAQFGTRIAALRGEVLADDELSAASRDALVKTLDKLSERLARLPPTEPQQR